MVDMIELFSNLLKMIFGENILRRHFRIQTGLLLLIVAGAVYGGIWIYRINWQWSQMKESNANIPITVSNAMDNAILQLKPWMNTIELGVIQSQSNEVLLSGQIQDVQKSQQINSRQIQRIQDYIEDSTGKHLDLNLNSNNATLAMP
jgi:hypothetical protein